MLTFCHLQPRYIFAHFYSIFKKGDLKNEESVLAWLAHQVESDEIEDVTDEMLDMLIEKSPNLAAFFCTLRLIDLSFYYLLSLIRLF